MPTNLIYRQTIPSSGPSSTVALGMPLTVDQVNQNFFALGVDISLRALKSGDTFSGNVSVAGAGNILLNTSGDLQLFRSGGTTAVIFLSSNGQRYLANDGTNYNLAGQGLIVGGPIQAIAAQFNTALAAQYGGTGVATLTGVAYANGVGAYTAATSGQIAASIGATYITNASYALLATSINGGSAGGLLYNSAVNVTASLNIGSSGTFVQSNGSIPVYVLLANADIPATLYGKTYNGTTPTSNSIGFSIAGGAITKTLTINNSLTFVGTDGTTFTLPTTSATLARTDASNTFVGNQTIGTLLTNAHAVNGALNVAGVVTATGLSVGSNGIVTNGGLTSNGNLIVNGNTSVTSVITLPSTLAAYVEVSRENTPATNIMHKFSWLNRFAVGSAHDTAEFVSGYGADVSGITPVSAVGFTRVRYAQGYMAFGHYGTDYLAINVAGNVTAYAGFTSNVGLTTLGTTNTGTLTAASLIVTGGITSVSGGAPGQLQAVGGSGTTWYNSFLRNDGVNVYLMSSAPQTASSLAMNASWNSFRPFGWNMSTGAVSIASDGAATNIGGNLYVSSAMNSATLTTTGNALVGGNLIVTGNLAVGGTIIQGIWHGSAVPVANGGTGSSSQTGALANLMPTGTTSGYVLTTSGPGSYFWAAPTGSTAPVGTTIQSSRGTATATAGQTVFTAPTYLPGASQLRVYINGIRQFATEYAETNATSFTLNAPGAALNDIVFIEVDGYVSYPLTALATSFTPVGLITSTNAQGAIADLELRKASLLNPTFTSNLTVNAHTTTAGITSTGGGGNNLFNAGSIESIAGSSGSTGSSLWAYNALGDGAAMMSFNRAGIYAVNFGIDTDNQLKIGGWSMGAVSYPVLHSGNLFKGWTGGSGYAINTWYANTTGVPMHIHYRWLSPAANNVDYYCSGLVSPQGNLGSYFTAAWATARNQNSYFEFPGTISFMVPAGGWFYLQSNGAGSTANSYSQY
jgi:hypothetical protein